MKTKLKKKPNVYEPLVFKCVKDVEGTHKFKELHLLKPTVCAYQHTFGWEFSSFLMEKRGKLPPRKTTVY